MAPRVPQVAQDRVAGVGLKTSKFHMLMHLVDGTMNFGAPSEVGAGANESGHEIAKAPAKLAQRCEEAFGRQTSLRLDGRHLLEMARIEGLSYAEMRM